MSTDTVALDTNGIVTRPVALDVWCAIELISRNTAYGLIRAGILPAHKKNPRARRSPWLITPAEHREYRRRASDVA